MTLIYVNEILLKYSHVCTCVLLFCKKTLSTANNNRAIGNSEAIGNYQEMERVTIEK